MSTKPPKGIQSKKYVLPEESEVLWHLLSGYLRFLRSHLNSGMYFPLDCWVASTSLSRVIYCEIEPFVYKCKPIERLSNTSVRPYNLVLKNIH